MKKLVFYLILITQNRLSEKIIKILSMDKTSLKSIGIEARKNIIQKFNVEKMCFSTYSEYKRIIN